MEKSRDALRTISEVADWLGVPTHVLRFWESRFSQIRPIKRAGGRRYYRPADRALVGGIKKLLHNDGLTIRGVQKILREQGVSAVISLAPPFEGLDNGTDPDDGVMQSEEIGAVDSKVPTERGDPESEAEPALETPSAETSKPLERKTTPSAGLADTEGDRKDPVDKDVSSGGDIYGQETGGSKPSDIEPLQSLYDRLLALRKRMTAADSASD